MHYPGWSDADADGGTLDGPSLFCSSFEAIERFKIDLKTGGNRDGSMSLVFTAYLGNFLGKYSLSHLFGSALLDLFTVNQLPFTSHGIFYATFERNVDSSSAHSPPVARSQQKIFAVWSSSLALLSSSQPLISVQ